jgi:acetyl coenzyme A synthetase (ADP forming)-like protein
MRARESGFPDDGVAPMNLDFRNYLAEAILRDGRSIYIRALRPDDRQGLLDLFCQLSPRSVYFRFFRFKKWLTEAELQQFTDLDFDRDVALIAAFQEGGRERILGVGRFSALQENGPRKAEVAFAVADAFQGKGAGTLLLEHLAVIARQNGITEFGADVLEENSQMIEVFTCIGFKVEHCRESGVYHFSFPTDLTQEFIAAQVRRERMATAESVRTFLKPRSIAIVGASRKHGTIGAALLSTLRRCHFQGTLYPVNPGVPEIDGLPAYPAVSAIHAPVDMALIAVPAAAVEEAIADCARVGVRSVVVISAGFGEVSAAGRDTEKRLRKLVRSSGMRMVGPNSMGVINTAPDVSMNANFVPVWPPAGSIGLLSQSGALGYSLLDRTPDLHVGISTFVSVGNKADVSVNDLLAYWSEDPSTQVIMLYLESFDQAAQFARMAPEIARQKPIVALKSGRSAAGTRAASSHTAALASSDAAVDAVFDQSGIIRAATVEQLLDITRLLSSQPLPPGPKVGAITNAGGPGILLADACETQGLVLPEYTPATLETLRKFLPMQAGLANPIDMLASAPPDHYARAIEIAAADPNIDSLIIIYLPPRLHDPEEMIKAITEAIERVPAEKPVLGVFMSARGLPPVVCKGPHGRVPLYAFPDNAAIALASARRYASWRDRPRGSILALETEAKLEIRAVVDRVLASGNESVWLAPGDLARILRAAGIAFAAAEEAGVDEAPAVADRLGYPLVAKVQAEGILHKSDVGGVSLGLESRTAVADAVAVMKERMRQIGIKLERVLLQREIRGGIEALAGVTVDANFGPMLACGLGGVLVEMIKDVVFRLPPVSDADAAEMIGRLRAGALLDGYRGAPPGDRQALAELLQRVSALIEIIPELQDLDLNPIKVLAPGHGAIAVDARMRIGRPLHHSDR